MSRAKTGTGLRSGVPVAVGLAMAWLAFVVAVALLAPWLSGYHYADVDLLHRLSPPVGLGGTWAHWLGTDELGRDIWSRLAYAIRISMLIAFLGTVIGAVFGTFVGMVAAHFRGWVDEIVMVAIDFQASIPFMIIALAVLAFFGGDLTLFVALMGLFGWERYARIARGMTLSARSQGYVIAVFQLGARPWRVYARHVFPNIANALIVNMTLNFPETILLETGLSFLGLGIQPPLTSLGNMAGLGRAHLTTAWWITLCPAIVIAMTTLSMSVVGDWVRDRMDPTLR